MIAGQKSRSVFEKYNIVNEEELKRVSKKVTEYHRGRAKQEELETPGHNRRR